LVPKRVDFYSKPGCPLCDEGEEVLSDLGGRFSFEVVTHNILADEALFARYRYAVPVVVIDGIERARLKFNEQELEAAFTAAQVPTK
jgi:glutaredoxin